MSRGDVTSETAVLGGPEEREADQDLTKPFDVGVLFVHGIGQQSRGATLTAFGDPVLSFLRRWLTKDDERERLRQERKRWHSQERAAETTLEADVDELRTLVSVSPLRLGGTALRLAARDPDAPSHLVVEVEVPSQGDPPEVEEATRWCFAESWWAEEFGAPEFATFARWALALAPQMIIAQFAKRFRYSCHRDLTHLVYWWRLVGELFLLVAAIPIAAVAVVGLLLLLILGVLPIPKASGFVAKIGLKLAASLGDSYALVESPTQFNAMVTRVSRDLAWLSGVSRNVVVVGHSQGAVVTHHALRRSIPAEVKSLVTCGSGLSKLNDIQRMRKLGELSAGWLALAYFFILIAVSFMGWQLSGHDVAVALGVAGGWGLITLIIWVVVIWDAVTTWEEAETRRRFELDLSTASHNEGIDWFDFYTTTDPVPNGPIFERSPGWPRFFSHQVWNRGSVLSDHSHYWNNPECFLAPLVAELGRLSGGHLERQIREEMQTLVSAQRRRRWRVGWLFLARMTMLAASLFVIIRLWSDISLGAERIIERAPDWITDRVGEIASGFQDLTELLHITATGVVGALTSVAVAIMVYSVIALTWRIWERRDIRRFFRREEIDLGGSPACIFVITHLLLAGTLVWAGFVDSWTSIQSQIVESMDRFLSVMSMPETGLVGMFIAGLLAFKSPRRPEETSDQRVTRMMTLIAKYLGSILFIDGVLVITLSELGRDVLVSSWGIFLSIFSGLLVFLIVKAYPSIARLIVKRSTRATEVAL